MQDRVLQDLVGLGKRSRCGWASLDVLSLLSELSAWSCCLAYNAVSLVLSADKFSFYLQILLTIKLTQSTYYY
jgi:hypothetical protein